MGLSGLNAHRKKYHFTDSSTCHKCQAKREDSLHFILTCPSYAAPRSEMITSVSQFLPQVPRLVLRSSGRDKGELVRLLLNGTGDKETDSKIFTSIAKFIKDTYRIT